MHLILKSFTANFTICQPQFSTLDVTNYASFDVLVQQIDEIVKDEGLNVLLNNAGISPKSTRLNFTKDSDLRETFETNSVAPIMLTKVDIMAYTILSLLLN